jgi:hypothetical protein
MTLKPIVDLELWSRPFDVQVPLDGKHIANDCRGFTGLSEDIVLGLSFIPDPTDKINIDISIARGEVTMQDFEVFCASNDLRPSTNDSISAARFIAYSYGQPLAWLHFPIGVEGLQMAIKVLNWASSNGFLVKIGQGEAQLSEIQVRQYWER